MLCALIRVKVYELIKQLKPMFGSFFLSFLCGFFFREVELKNDLAESITFGVNESLHFFHRKIENVSEIGETLVLL